MLDGQLNVFGWQVPLHAGDSFNQLRLCHRYAPSFTGYSLPLLIFPR